MPTLTPYAGLSISRLVTMINTDNDRELVFGVDFNLSAPQAVENGPQGRNAKVTFIPLQPLIDEGFTDEVDLFYWRLGIDAIGRLPSGSVDLVPMPELPSTTLDNLDAINAALGLNLLPSEVENLTYSVSDLHYPLTIKPNSSYAWAQSTYNFMVDNPDHDIPLSSVITTTDLDGFDYVRPPSP